MSGVYRRRAFYERLRPGSAARGSGATLPIFNPPPGGGGTLMEVTQFDVETGILFIPDFEVSQFAIETGYRLGGRGYPRFIGL